MTHQVSLFRDPNSERADEIGRELVQQLHSFARHHGAPRPTVVVWGVQVVGGSFTAQLVVNGKPLSVINRADVGAAARDLWERVDGGTR
jgi:hypothetical protein